MKAPIIAARLPLSWIFWWPLAAKLRGNRLPLSSCPGQWGRRGFRTGPAPVVATPSIGGRGSFYRAARPFDCRRIATATD